MRLSNGGSRWAPVACAVLIGLMAGVRSGRGAQGATMQLGVWRFLPCGKDGKSDYSDVDVDDRKWLPCRFPHRDWDRVQPEDGVYGWYRFRFSVPGHLAGRDLILDLGFVDDCDEVYFNGRRVGASGAFPPEFKSAWSVERSYRVPAMLVRSRGENVVAVKVYDAGGVGGMLCQPVIGAALVSEDAVWMFRGAGQNSEAEWSGADVDDTAWQHVAIPDRRDPWPSTLEDWEKVKVAKEGWNARQPGGKAYGWYRLRFHAPEVWRHEKVLLDLGRVYDVDAAYLNGRAIGMTGEFPGQSAGATPVGLMPGVRRVYELPPDSMRYGQPNVLTVKVYCEEGMGGIIDVPSLRIASAPSVGHDSAAKESTAALAARIRGLRIVAASMDQTARVRANALGELCRLYGAAGRLEEQLTTFQQLSSQFREESSARETVASLVRAQHRMGSLSEKVVYLGQDTRTRGDWPLAYGNSGFILCSMAGNHDVFGRLGKLDYEDPYGDWSKQPRNRPIAYRSYYPGAEETRNWLHEWRSRDPGALWNPLTGSHTCVWWDDYGERHPFDNRGPDIFVELRIPAGPHRLSLYMVDADWRNTSRPRNMGIVVFDDSWRPLAAALTGRFGRGQYERFAVLGPLSVKVRIYKHESVCAVLSGVFLDRDFGPGRIESMPSRSAAAEAAWLKEYKRLGVLWAKQRAAYYRSLPAWRRLAARCRKLATAKMAQGDVKAAAAWGWWQSVRQVGTLGEQRVACAHLAASLSSDSGAAAALAWLYKASGRAKARRELGAMSALDRQRMRLLAFAWDEKPASSRAAAIEILAAWTPVHLPEARALMQALAKYLTTTRSPREACAAIARVGLACMDAKLPNASDVAYQVLKKHFDRRLVLDVAGKFLLARAKAEQTEARMVAWGARRAGTGRADVAEGRLLAALEEYGDHPSAALGIKAELVPVWQKLGMYEDIVKVAPDLLADPRLDGIDRENVLAAKAEAEVFRGRLDDAVQTYMKLFEYCCLDTNRGRQYIGYRALCHAAYVRCLQGRYDEAVRLAEEASKHRFKILDECQLFPAKMDFEYMKHMADEEREGE